MTSGKPWQCSLDEALQRIAAQKFKDPPRISILGIGNELRGDDNAGVAVARSLAALASESLQVIEGAHAPENQLGIICRFAPDLVLMIDAVDMDQSPGQVAWIEWRATAGISASTHTMPLYMIGKYLQSMTGCKLALIGIQPTSVDLRTRDLQARMNSGMSAEVEAAVAEVSQMVRASLVGLAASPDPGLA